MGLGIWMLAEPERRGFLKRRPAAESLLKEVADTLCGAVIDRCPLLQGYARAFENPSSNESDGSATREWLVRLYPAEEEVRISNERGGVLFSARTNGAGPGYHACLIAALDQVVLRCRLSWVLERRAFETEETGTRIVTKPETATSTRWTRPAISSTGTSNCCKRRC